MIQSKFNYKAYVSLPFIGAFTILIIVTLLNFEETFSGLGGGLFVISLLSFMNFTLIFTTFKTQKITLDNHTFIVTNLLGKGLKSNYSLKDITGYHTGSYTHKGNVENIIYIVKGSKKLARLSDNYHKNFSELKFFIENNLTNLGHVKISILSEFSNTISNKQQTL